MQHPITGPCGGKGLAFGEVQQELETPKLLRSLGREPLEERGGERRQGHRQTMRPSHVRSGRRLEAAHISDIRATVGCRIGVQGLLVEAGLRHSNAVTFANHRSCVQNDYEHIFGPLATADKGKDAVVGVVAVEPFKSAPVKIDFMQSRFRSEEFVEIGDEPLNTPV